MKKKLFAAGLGSLSIAAALALLNFTKVETWFTEPIVTNIKFYPAAFFALLGLMFFFQGLKPLWKN